MESVSNVYVSDDDDDLVTYYERTDNIELKNKAILAVTSTAGIIKLSEFLQTHEFFDAKTNLEIMAASDLIQWIALDGTPVALVASIITSIGGPLSELPFVAHGFWHYIPQSAVLHTSGKWIGWYIRFVSNYNSRERIQRPSAI